MDDLKEYIEREAAKEAYRKFTSDGDEVERAWYVINSIPAADVRPAVRGKWIDDKVAFYRGCPKCGCYLEYAVDTFLDNGDHYNFCPNCGAYMRGN